MIFLVGMFAIFLGTIALFIAAMTISILWKIMRVLSAKRPVDGYWRYAKASLMEERQHQARKTLGKLSTIDDVGEIAWWNIKAQWLKNHRKIRRIQALKALGVDASVKHKQGDSLK